MLILTHSLILYSLYNLLIDGWGLGGARQPQRGEQRGAGRSHARENLSFS